MSSLYQDERNMETAHIYASVSALLRVLRWLAEFLIDRKNR